MENKQVQKHKRKNKYAAPIGGAFMLLALIGLVTVVLQSFRLTAKIMDNSGQLKEFESLIKPVIMFDPVPFETVEQADNTMLLQSSLWSALINNPDEFDYDANGMMVLTSSDVDVACAKLFGAGVKLEHKTFGDYETTYYFDEETKTYQIPTIVEAGFYTPKIVDVSKKNDIISIVVGYLPPTNIFTTSIKGDQHEPNPDKYMLYELKKVKNNYIISAIKDPPESYRQYPTATEK